MLTTEWGPVRYPSCRDKGRMSGRVGALCLSSSLFDSLGPSWSKQVAPQPGQAQDPLIHSTPPLVPTGPWAASTLVDRIPRFGRQNSLVTRLLRIGLRHAQLSPKSLAIG